MINQICQYRFLFSNYIYIKPIIDTIKGLKMPKKVTDFDKDRFVADLESVFKAEHWID